MGTTSSILPLFHGKRNVVKQVREDGSIGYLASGMSLKDAANAAGADGFATYHGASKHVFFLMKGDAEVSRAHIAKALQEKKDEEIAADAANLQICETFNSDKYNELKQLADATTEALKENGFSGAELNAVLAEEGLTETQMSADCWVPTLCKSGDLQPLKATKFAF